MNIAYSGRYANSIQKNETFDEEKEGVHYDPSDNGHFLYSQYDSNVATNAKRCTHNYIEKAELRVTAVIKDVPFVPKYKCGCCCDKDKKDDTNSGSNGAGSTPNNIMSDPDTLTIHNANGDTVEAVITGSFANTENADKATGNLAGSSDTENLDTSIPKAPPEPKNPTSSELSSSSSNSLTEH